jgi:hypothetical protein
MKIVVIGKTLRVRSEIVERLREKGHNAVAAAPGRAVNRTRTQASCDPGYAGRHLRKFLEQIAAVVRNRWLARNSRFGRLRQLLRNREASR